MGISQELSPVLFDGIDAKHEESEDHTHDRRIMGPTRHQLRYFRLVCLSKSVAMRMIPSGEAARSSGYLRLLLLLLLQP